MIIYTAKVVREDRLWVITVDGVGVTQARYLGEAEDMARDLVAIVRDVDAATIEVDLQVELG